MQFANILITTQPDLDLWMLPTQFCWQMKGNCLLACPQELVLSRSRLDCTNLPLHIRVTVSPQFSQSNNAALTPSYSSFLATELLLSTMPGLHMSAYAPPGSMAWSATHHPVAAPTQSTLTPTLKFFIERNDGSLVPLVPVDELPDDVRLVGVPLSLSTFQAQDMLFLGHDSSVGRKFSHAGAMGIKETVVPSMVAMRSTPQPDVATHSHHVTQVSTTAVNLSLLP